jgi:hypothetical protein
LRPLKSTTKNLHQAQNLYIELQKSLNYEGKDAYLDAKKHVALKAHIGNVYEGIVFEEALFKEYQNTLKKVALMYQAAKFDAAAPAEFLGNPTLVNFIKAIDGSNDSNYITTNNVNNVIDGLQQASVAKYPADSKLRLNDNDKYLLKKLLTHAQDRLCSIEHYQKTGKSDHNFSASHLEQVKNAPLNQLIFAIKDAQLTKDSDITLSPIVDEKVAINSAIAANINALTEWAKKNKSCIPAIKTLGFMNSIQAGIQQCNYRKFVDALDDQNSTNIESILHFINSNEKFLKGIQTKAETALDEFKLQSYVDSALSHLSDKINCTEISNSTKTEKQLFVRNLPYSKQTNKFDTSKILCKIKIKATKFAPASETTLSEQECSSKIDLISDELGRGLEVRAKEEVEQKDKKKKNKKKEDPISFSIIDNPDCQDIDLSKAAEEVKLAEEVKPAEDLKPVEDVKPNKESKSSKVVIIVFDFTPGNCKKEGEKNKTPTPMTSNKEKTACIPRLTDADCKKLGENKIPNEDGNECIDKTTEVKPALDCSKEGKNKIPSPTDPTKCIDKLTEKTKDECEAIGKDLSENKLSCIDKKESDAEKECREKNIALKTDEADPTPTDWKVKDGKCINTKDKGDSKFKDSPTEEPEIAAPREEKPFTAPPRFVPIQIPTRQMYILPGMP